MLQLRFRQDVPSPGLHEAHVNILFLLPVDDLMTGDVIDHAQLPKVDVNGVIIGLRTTKKSLVHEFLVVNVRPANEPNAYISRSNAGGHRSNQAEP